jgi:hypothetical protein
MANPVTPTLLPDPACLHLARLEACPQCMTSIVATTSSEALCPLCQCCSEVIHSRLVHRNQAVLSQCPVWLFSSGPLGTEVKDAEQQPKEMAEFQQVIGPREQRIFFGALDHSHLSFAERVMVKAVRAPEGDFRDWEAIEAWAASIARDLG